LRPGRPAHAPPRFFFRGRLLRGEGLQPAQAPRD
jgi:hypothetical protein